MSKLALPPPSPHSSRTTHYAMFKRHPHGSGFLTRGCHARASLDFCTFCFHNLHRETKNQDYFQPKTEDKNRAKNILHFHKNVGDSHKNVGDFWKNVGDFLENVGRFSWNTRKSSQLNQDTSSSQPQNRGKESHLPKTSLLPSTFSIASTENPSVILRQNPPFQPSISPFQPAFS